MKTALQSVLGWLLVALLAYGAIAIRWDEWGAKAVIQRVSGWRGWVRLRRWTADRLRALARALDGRGARHRKTIFTGEIPRDHWRRSDLDHGPHDRCRRCRLHGHRRARRRGRPPKLRRPPRRPMNPRPWPSGASGADGPRSGD